MCSTWSDSGLGVQVNKVVVTKHTTGSTGTLAAMYLVVLNESESESIKTLAMPIKDANLSWPGPGRAVAQAWATFRVNRGSGENLNSARFQVQALCQWRHRWHSLAEWA